MKKETEIAELESDKATLMLVAEESGKISFKATEGEMLAVGAVACTIDTSVQPEESTKPKESLKQEELLNEQKSKKPEAVLPTERKLQPEIATATEKGKSLSPDNIATEAAAKGPADPKQDAYDMVRLTPLAKKVMEMNDLSVDDVIKGLRRLRREDVEAIVSQNSEAHGSLKKNATRNATSSKLSQLRRKLSERLVSVKNETAMLTTFNEVNMKPIMDLRKKHQNAFVEKHGIKLGMMSFFMKASAIALQEFPNVNAMLDGENLVTFDYADISVAVSTPKGLMVPVVRNVESLGLAEIEKALADVAEKARKGKLSIPEMTGGTFTITNGGVFGSMMSTPLINPPQSAILGMHNILDRPVALEGQVVIRPMMYVALSYDHRVIDGKDSVGFLLRVKQLLENPAEMLFGSGSSEKSLLEI